ALGPAPARANPRLRARGRRHGGPQEIRRQALRGRGAHPGAAYRRRIEQHRTAPAPGRREDRHHGRGNGCDRRWIQFHPASASALAAPRDRTRLGRRQPRQSRIAERTRPPHPQGSLPPGAQAPVATQARLSIMNWLSRLKAARGGAQALSPQAEQTLRTWQALPDAVLDRPHFESRYVVVNTEATGLDLDSDRLLAVGAVGADGGLLHPADAY